MNAREMNKRFKEDAESFIECVWDDFNKVFRLKLMWWVTFEISLHRCKLEALKRVIDRALKASKV